MPFASANNIELCYDTFGDAADPTILLVMGFTAQMTAWDEGFCNQLAEHGRHVVRYDNRDCGLSTKFDDASLDVAALMMAQEANGEIPEVPYDLSDMAADGLGLLDALDIERAHVVGASMGGMIAQTMAIDAPHRLMSMTSMMSTTGNPEYFESAPEAMAALLTPAPTDREAYIDGSISAKIWASQRYFDAERARERAAAAYDRSFYPAGAARQLGAVVKSGDRDPLLANVEVPTLVIHGRDDTLIMPSGGLRTAEVIPGAHLLLVSDMGHDFPPPLQPMLIDAIVGHTHRAAG